MEGHPQLSTLFLLFNSENQPFRKVHRMIDLFESIIKTYTVVIISEYVKRNKLSDTAKELLAHGLRTPSLGTWQLFSRVLFEELNNEKHQWMLTDFKADFEYLDKALKKEKTDAIFLRNSYAHGATPSDEKCTLDINKFEPFLNQLLLTKWFENTRLEVIDGMVFMISGNNALCLHPILLYRREESPASFAFFNDLKNEKVGLLNYPLAKHYREKILYKEFHQYLPLHLWKTKGNNKFYQYIEELTETFKGRTSEREALLQFVLKKNKGYLSVQGNPGIGKSALLAQLLKDLVLKVEDDIIKVVPYFIRRGTFQARVNHFLNYLINSTDEIFPQGRDIHAKDQTSWSLQSQLFQKWNQWAENNNGNKILFLIDGLDEGIDENMVEFMPRENFENILFIYGSRAGGHYSINEFWGTLPTEHHTKLELKGLNKEDIRAMIYEVANKYEVERESSWINAVLERSQGNPLYMKLLCDAIENGHIALNEFNALPKEIDDYYKAILQRYAKDNDGDALFLGLYTFAAAKNYLTIPQLGLINKLSDATLERVSSTLKEVLNENPLTKDVLDYQLFHESFREYLVKQNSVKVMEAADRLINFCSDWQTLEGTYEQRYALEYYAIHLIESKKEVHHKELLALLKNEPYQVVQKRVLKQFDATKQLYQLSLIKAGELNKHDIQLEAALGLLDLKYEVVNDAPQIVLLIANGEIDLGLKRIESFAGPDEEGVKRKFILYMLCLMELTLLDSKDKSHRKISIEKLLNHLDEHLPVDQSLINWNDFFPSYLVFLMATEWAKLGLDYLIVYKRTRDWEKEWIKEKGPYSDIQFEVLSACVESINEELDKIEAKIYISSEMAKQGNNKVLPTTKELAITFSNLTSDIELYFWSKTLKNISKYLVSQGFTEEAILLVRGITLKKERCLTFVTITSELFKQGKKELALEVIKEALVNKKEINDKYDRGVVTCFISTQLADLGKEETARELMEEVFFIIKNLNGNYREKLLFLNEITPELIKQGRKKVLNTLIYEVVELLKIIDDIGKKSHYLTKFINVLTAEGGFEEATLLANEMNVEISLSDLKKTKSETKKNIIARFVKNGLLNNAKDLIIEDFKDHSVILTNEEKNNFLNEIGNEYENQGKFEEAIRCKKSVDSNDVDKISEYLELNNDRDKIKAILNNSWELANQGKIDDSNALLQEAIVLVNSFSIQYYKCVYLFEIYEKLCNLGRIDEADLLLKQVINIADKIIDLSSKIQSYRWIIRGLIRMNKYDEALLAIHIAFDSDWDNKSGDELRLKITKIFDLDFCKDNLDEALLFVRQIRFLKMEQSYVLAEMGIKYFKTGKEIEAASLFQEAISIAREISYDYWRFCSLLDILLKIKPYEKFFNTESLMAEVYEFAKNDIYEDLDRSKALSSITLEFSKLGKLDLAYETIQGIKIKTIKDSTLYKYAIYLAIHGKINDALDYISSSGLKQDEFLIDLSNELTLMNKVDEAINISLKITNSFLKSDRLNEILFEAIVNWALCERIVSLIPESNQRHNSWEHFAKKFMLKEGWQNALLHVNKLQKEEARFFYLKGLVKNLTLIETNSECVEQVLPYLTNDTESIEKLMQNYALRELFFGDSDQNKIHRLNQSLNIKWAMDIKKEFPSVALSSRVYANIKEWLHDIYDEDIKDQIELWARQVSKGKISEDQFNAEVESLLSN